MKLAYTYRIGDLSTPDPAIPLRSRSPGGCAGALGFLAASVGGLVIRDGRNSVRPGEGTAIGINASASADRRECLEIRLAPSNETSLPDLSLVWALLARVHKEELQICQA